MRLEFEWDEAKAKANLKKHKVSFQDGKTIFNDPLLLTFPDQEHSEHEERYINIGVSAEGNVIVLVSTERRGKIRIINCRKATSHERRFYEKGNY
jgi:uncharacterized protein